MPTTRSILDSIRLNTNEVWSVCKRALFEVERQNSHQVQLMPLEGRIMLSASPIAVANVDVGAAYTVVEGNSITLDGSASTDDVSIELYEWDFDYDGTFDVDASSTSDPTATFDASGINGPAIRTIALRITDDSGNTSFDTATVNILDSVTYSSLWLATKSDVSGSGIAGLDNWTDGTVLQLSNPNLSLEPGTSSGTFSAAFNLDDFTLDGDAEIRGLHFVSRNLTVGGANSIDLLVGDILLSTNSYETYNGSGGNTLSAFREDIFVFRPDSAGDYGSGTFFLLFDNPGGAKLHAFTLVESDTLIGDTTVRAGDLLLATAGPHEEIKWFQTSDVGEGTTAGTLVTLIDGNDIGFNDQIQGLELVETHTTIAGRTLNPGQLVMTLNRSETIGATTIGPHDLFVLNVTATTLGSGTATGTVSLFLQGTDLGLNSTDEQIYAFSFAHPQVNAVPTASNLNQVQNYGQGDAAVPLDDIVVNDSDAGELITATLTLANTAAGSLSTSSGNGESYSSITGVWTITASVAQVNSALAAVEFFPVAVSPVNTSISTRIVDSSGSGPTVGTIFLNATNPTLVNTGEFRVNQTTGDDQQTSGDGRGSQNAVAIDADGNYVVVWSSLNQDGSEWGVYARRFDSTGAALTGEILVAETTARIQQWARVASALDGSFVVTWTHEPSVGSEDVYFRRFAANGTPLTGEILASTTTLGTQKNSSISMNRATGEFIIIWQGSGTQPGEVDANGIFGQRFTANGAKLGGEFRINASTSGTQYDATVSVNTNGQFAVVWDDNNGFHLQRFDSSGNEVGGQVTIDSSISAGNGSVAVQNDGSLVVVWREGSSGFRDVLLQRIGSGGTALTGRLTVATTPFGDQTNPSIGMDANGNFIVTWEGTGSQPGQSDLYGVFGQKYNSAAAKIGGEFLINQTDTLSAVQGMASVALLDINNFVAVWSGSGDRTGQNDSSGIFARQFGTGNRAPTSIAPGAFNIDEQVDTSGGYVVGLLSATDPDSNETLTFTVIGGPDRTKFSIGGAGNNELLLDDGILDFETKSSYSVIVRVTDSALNTFDQTLTISVKDLNDRPVITSNGGGATANINVAENSTFVTTVTATDADLPAQTLTYSIAGGPDASKFTINATTGQLEFINAPDFESPGDGNRNNIYEVRVRASDGLHNSKSQWIVITVTNVNEPPTISFGNTVMAVDENVSTTSAIRVADININDDGMGSNQLGLSGADAGKFEIVGGQLWLKAGTVLDFESFDTYTVIVSVNDPAIGVGVEHSISFTLAINNINEGPVFVGPAQVNLSEDAPLTTFNWSSWFVDADGDSLTFSIVSVADSWVNATIESGNMLALVADPNVWGNSSIVVRAVDSGGLIATANVAINVSPVNDTVMLSNLLFRGGNASPVIAGVLLNSTFDVDGDFLTVVVTSAPTGGQLVVNPDGSFQFTPDPTFSGVSTFKFVVADGVAVSNEATVRLLGSQAGPTIVTAPTPMTAPQPTPSTPANEPTTNETKTEETAKATETPIVGDNGKTAAGDGNPDGNNSINSESELTDSTNAGSDGGSIVLDSLTEESQSGPFQFASRRISEASDAFGTTVIDSVQTAYTTGVSTFAIITQPGLLWNDLDLLRKSTQSQTVAGSFAVGSVGTVTSSLIVGYVIWAVRSGLLLSSVMATMPAWNLLDPLAIVPIAANGKREDGESLEDIVENQSKKLASQTTG